MPKVDVSMSEAEWLAFLTAQRGCVVAARTPSGDIVPALGRATLNGGVLHVTLAAHDPAADALREDGRVCCLVEESPTYYEIVSVGVRGVAQNLGVRNDQLGFDLAVDDVVSSSFAKLRSQDGIAPAQ
jgi:hypothetical protein